MDEFLTKLYGTNADVVEPVDELEKMAQYRLLEKIAADEGVDLDQLTEEEVEELATELANDLAADDETPDDGQVNSEEEMEKEAQAKVEESDFLGRVMAHSMWQELGEIEKVAGARTDAAKESLKKGYAWLRGKTSGRIGEALQKKLEGSTGERTRSFVHAVGGARRQGAPGKFYTPQSAETFEKGKRRLGAAAEIGTALGTAGLAGGAGYGGYRGVKAILEHGKAKKSSAFDTLVEERAYQHLLAAGLADDQGNIVTPDAIMQKTAGDNIDTQVDRAALEYLQELGYPVEWY